jgi:archaemetzincin
MIHLLAVGEGVEPDRLDALAAELARTFHVSCHVREGSLDAGFARDPVRGQYHSTAILERMQPLAGGARLLGVSAYDLYVPIFTFVFGEAQLEGACAVVSWHRLAEERYGLPPDEAKLRERLTKEAVHELGHTFGLRHCDDWRCVMARNHSVERLDVKSASFCEACSRRVFTESGSSCLGRV